jgi:ATP-dependent DNA helicase RecG
MFYLPENVRVVMGERTPDEVYLDQLISTPREHRTLEFKAAKNSFSFDETLKYCAALSNEGGGILLLGVTDKFPRAVTGTRAFENPQDTEFKLHLKLNIKILVEERTYEGKRVLAIHSPKRPPGTPIHVDGRYLMRSGESLVPMTPDELRRIFDEPRGHFLDRPAISGLDPEGILRLLDVPSFFSMAAIQVPGSTAGIISRLESWKLVATDSAQTLCITNMGALLFARSLEDFGDLRHKRLRITRFSGETNVDAVYDHFENRGYAVAFDAVLQLLSAMLPVNEEIKASLRATVPLYPEIALREFLANAFIHQDFEQLGVPLSVELYDGRLEITNPGLPVIDVKRFVDDSQTRNADLSSAMLKLGICESRGSGVDRVLNEIELHQVAAPLFTTGSSSTRVTLLSRRKFEQMTADERTWTAYMHCCLKYVGMGFMTNTSLRERFGLTAAKTPQTSQVISEAVKSGLVKLDPSASSAKKSARYLPEFA